MSDVKVTTLGNGLRIAVDAMPEVESASLGIWVACGTRHESAELNGMAHMLEHMAFKGTKTRSARAIAEEIENVGGSLNAYTGREITAYHASVLKEDVGLGVEMVADILRNSVFDPDELQRERGVILQEIGQALDTPDDLIFDQFQETALPGQPLGRPVLGTADSVEAIGRDDLFAFLARHYTASNMVLSAAGRVEHDQIVDLAEKHFGSVPRTPANAIIPTPLRYVGGDGRETRVLEQAHLVLGCEGIGYRDPTISRSPSIRRCSAAACPRACSSASARSGAWSTASTASTPPMPTAACSASMPARARTTSPSWCRRCARSSVGVADTLNEQELIRARNQIKAGTLMALESSGARCEQAARHLIVHNRPIPYAEIVARIEAVDQDAVRRVARRLLKGELTLAALGPIDALESIDKIAARLAA